ncbi:hypothetical protein ACOMHN_016980 [Nucella lapillus]
MRQDGVKRRGKINEKYSDKGTRFFKGLALGAMRIGKLLLFAQSLSNSLHLPPQVQGKPSYKQPQQAKQRHRHQSQQQQQ